MKKEWGFIEKILAGKKTIESRWYKNKYKPWDAVKRGDTVYFKNSGGMVVVKSQVGKVMQFSDLNPVKIKNLLNIYGKNIGIDKKDMPIFHKILGRKKYSILIFLKSAESIKPFQISKKGFGAMASWIIVEDISKIKYRLT